MSETKRDCKTCKNCKPYEMNNTMIYACGSWNCNYDPYDSNELVCIKDVLDQIDGWIGYELKDFTNPIYYLRKRICELPGNVSVKPKIGHWIPQYDKDGSPTYEEVYSAVYECSICGGISFGSDYCPNCGADMGGEV